MTLIVGPKEKVGRDGGSFQECGVNAFGMVTHRYERYCTIRDDEFAPPTSAPGRKWVQIFRTPDSQF
ncbi:hypothetical protein ACK2MR_22335 [Providencia hangzhouensis]|uniref:hypothetical protein n=1 Tax=Providencia hangzhouensis TaxID=3031799 RepID=UPI003F1A78A7